MKTLYLMVVKSFLPVLLMAVLFFVLVLQLLDVFANLWRYLAHEAGLREIGMVAWLYLPKCISYAIAPGMLFAASFTLGTFYRNNELIAVLGSGVSLYRLVVPFIVFGAAASVGGFYFNERVVIDTFRQKNELYSTVVKQSASLSNTNVTVMSGDTRTIYQVDYYNDQKQTLNNVLIVTLDAAGRFRSRIDADWGEWNGRYWLLHNARRYGWNESGVLVLERFPLYESERFAESPSTFRKTSRNVDEMTAQEAGRWLQSLRRAGLPYRETLTKYYARYFFALSPLIVALIASGVGSRFKRNILLMNLLAALVVSVVYYVVQMVSVILAKSGFIPPLAGAGAGVVLFLAAGGVLLRQART